LEELDNPDDIGRLIVVDTWTMNCDRFQPFNGAKLRQHKDNVWFSKERASKGGSYCWKWRERIMSVKDKPHFTLPAATLAGWIERQSDRWWSVDGDPRLTSIVDFPCPGDELAPVIRKIGKDLLVYDGNNASTAHGEVIGSDRLDELADVSNWLRHKTFLLSWADSDIDWLLVEDDPLV